MDAVYQDACHCETASVGNADISGDCFCWITVLFDTAFSTIGFLAEDLICSVISVFVTDILCASVESMPVSINKAFSSIALILRVTCSPSLVR